VTAADEADYADLLRHLRAAGSPADPATPDDLRAMILDGLDRVLAAPWVVQRFVTDNQRRLMRAMQTFWSTADAATLAAVLAQYQRQP
jgi:hypothetical protein